MQAQGVLEAKGLAFAYDGTMAVKDVSFAIAKGDFVALIGPNGSGKTTLLKLLLGLLRPLRGEVSLDGKPVLSYSPKERARKMAYVAQEPELRFPLTVRELVSLGRYPYLRRFQGVRADGNTVEEALRLTGTGSLKERKFTALSGGERQRVLISRALAQCQELLLLDEPTLHLDLRVQMEILKTLKGLCAGRRSAVVAVVHDLNLASLFADRVLLLRAGALAAFGRVEDVVHEGSIREIFGVEVIVTRDQETGARYFLPRRPVP